MLRAGAAIGILAGYAVAAVVVLAPRVHPPSRTAGLSIAPPLVADVPAERVAAVSPVRFPAPAQDSAQLERLAVLRFAHGPLAQVLRPRAGGPALADSIARALVREAARVRVAPSLLAAILITENPRLQPDTVSSMGAVGLMQVMPFHAGEHGCGSSDLVAVDANICHGARILGAYLRRTGNMRVALLRYNGCVRSVNTPRCDRYPSKVLRLAGKLRHQLLAYADRRAPAPAAPPVLAVEPVTALTSPAGSAR